MMEAFREFAREFPSLTKLAITLALLTFIPFVVVGVGLVLGIDRMNIGVTSGYLAGVVAASRHAFARIGGGE